MTKSLSVFVRQYKLTTREGSHGYTWTTDYDHRSIRDVLRKNSLFITTKKSEYLGKFENESYMWFDGKLLSRITVSLNNPSEIKHRKGHYCIRVDVETMPPLNLPKGLVELLNKEGFNRVS